MSNGVFWRTACVLVLTLAVCVLRPVHARGQDLLGCPAGATSLTAVTGSSGTLFAFHLVANGVRTIDGNVMVDTNRGWFSLPLHNVKTEKTSSGFGSPTLYAEFPAPLQVVNDWLAQVGTTQCYPPPALPTGNREWPYTPQKNSDIVQATIAQPYGSNDCTEPFAPVRALNVVLPDFDRKNASFPGVAVIDVTVDLNGKPIDATIAQSSHTAGFDDAARDAALKSTYSAAVAYCLPTIATYGYKATIKP